eukprot:2657770-Amphidinium_carterae.1
MASLLVSSPYEWIPIAIGCSRTGTSFRPKARPRPRSRPLDLALPVTGLFNYQTVAPRGCVSRMAISNTATLQL